MELENLKNAWDQFSSKEKEKELDVNTIGEMLRGRTKNLIERIDRNIKIGFFIILALIVIFILDDLILSPFLVKGIYDGLEVPEWIITMDIITNLVIILTFVAFVYKYYQTKRNCDFTHKLEETLTKIIHILNLYQRMFYLAIIILVLSTATGFIAGMYKGIITGAQENGILISEIDRSNILLTIGIGVIVLILISGGLFLLFQWGFRRLYGNYLTKLKLTLKELSEIE